MEIDELVNISRPEILPDFSGTIRYQKKFDICGQWNEETILELGDVYETANVWINDQKIGSVICPHYIMPIPKGILKEKDNNIIIEVTNTLVKQLHDNIFDKYMPQEPSGLLGPVNIKYS